MQSVLARVCVGVAGVALLGWFGASDYPDYADPAVAAPPSAEDASVDVTPRSIALAEPGTVIEDGPPKGWSHLVSLSHAKIGTGDLNQATNFIKHLASFLGSTMLANVEPVTKAGVKKYRLEKVGYGITNKINGKDTVITADTQNRLGAKLGLFERLGLQRAEARLPDLLVMARSDTMAIIDAHSQVLRNGKHVEVIVRHALLVDTKTGNLKTGVWMIDLDENGRYAKVCSGLEVLPPNMKRDLVLNIDEDEFLLGVITEKALAVSDFGRKEEPTPLSETVAPLAAKMRLTASDFTSLEQQLQRFLAQSKSR